MYAAYWQKDELEVYRLSAPGVEKIAAGAIGELQPIRSFGKKLLIVGSEKSLHVRKRYPAISEKDLAKAIGHEIGELLPIANPAFHFQIQEREKLFMLVDIWAWDGAEADRIKGAFEFTHVVPEDLAYRSDRPELVLYGTDELQHLAAYAAGKFLGSTSFVNSVPLAGVALFIKSLGRHSTDLKTLRVVGSLGSELNPPDLEVIREPSKSYPFCLDHLSKIKLRDFRVEQERLPTLIDISLKSAAALSLAYALSLFLSIRNYDAALTQLDQKLNAVATQSAAAVKVKPGEDYSATLLELERKLNGGIRPLEAMELLAENLPANSFLLRLTLNDKNLAAYVSSKDPLDVIKALSSVKGINSVKLKGALNKDGRTGAYNFLIEIGL